MTDNKRESDRKRTLNLLDYVVLDESGKKLSRAMGRTLNVSEKGILLETFSEFNKGQELLITLGLKNDLIEVRGRVVHCEGCNFEAFCSGIEFISVSDEEMLTLRRFLNAFNQNQQTKT